MLCSVNLLVNSSSSLTSSAAEGGVSDVTNLYNVAPRAYTSIVGRNSPFLDWLDCSTGAYPVVPSPMVVEVSGCPLLL